MQRIADLIADRVIIAAKEVLTRDEAARYMGIHIDRFYRLTTMHQFPQYKPTGGKCYYRRKDLEEWLTHNKEN